MENFCGYQKRKHLFHLLIFLCYLSTSVDCIQGVPTQGAETRETVKWNALGDLSKLTSLTHLAEEYCDLEESQDKHERDPHIPERPPFVQSEYLPWPMNINVFEQMCLIGQGKSPSVLTCTNHNFPLLHNAPRTCKHDQPVDILLIVTSDVNNFEQRDLIRRLWANTACWLGARVKHVFLVEALTVTALSEATVVGEQEIYNDIIQQGYVVNDNNSTSYKLLLAFRWFLSHCPQAKWLLLVKDDQFVNPFNVISFLLSVSEAMHQRLAVGSVWYEPSIRSTVKRWQLDVDPTITKGRYPTFVATSGVLISSVLIPRLYITMRFTQLPEHPDLFLAHALRKLFILPAHFNDFYAYDRRPANNEQFERAIIFPAGGKLNQTSWWEEFKCEQYC